MVCTKHLPSVALGTSGFSLCGYTTHFTLVPVFSLDILTTQVGILGIFSDWPETVTYYANCMNIK